MLSGETTCAGDLPVSALQVADLGVPGDLAEQAFEPLRPAKQHLDHQQRSPVTDPGKRLGKRGRAVLRFSHGRILDTGVDSWAVAGSNLQVTSYWRHGGDDNP